MASMSTACTSLLPMASSSSPPFRRQRKTRIRTGSSLLPQAAFKVAVVGAGTPVGRPLSLLLKMSPYIGSLSLHDSADLSANAEHLNHCNTPCQVAAFSGLAGLSPCVRGAHVVVLMTHHEEEAFDVETRTWLEAVADDAADAFVHIVSSSANVAVPAAAEVMKRLGVYDPRKLFGVTTLDVVRASTFAAEKKRLRVMDVSVPVVGGHEGDTILPLLSKVRPRVDFTEAEAAELTKRVRRAESEVAAARGDGGSASLSAAYAAARFVESSLRALDGDEGVYECALVASEITEVPFFASRIRMSLDGVEEVVSSDLQGITAYEAAALEELKPALLASIEKGMAVAAAI